ncbi:hypothetical protein J6590_026266 [Homalodisca vitripennis]|nr:hypothetical protein J6590_026266 [Homalodisca vitripennis]
MTEKTLNGVNGKKRIIPEEEMTRNRWKFLDTWHPEIVDSNVDEILTQKSRRGRSTHEAGTFQSCSSSTHGAIALITADGTCLYRGIALITENQ